MRNGGVSITTAIPPMGRWRDGVLGQREKGVLMDFNSTPHLLQALLVCICVILFVMGFKAGNMM